MLSCSGRVLKIMISRIRKITEELQGMHAEISSQISPDSSGQKQFAFDEANAMELLTDFKLAIDQLRSVLQLYVEAFSDRTEQDPALKTTHLLRATEMLRALSQPQSARSVSAFQEGSFFDRLHIVMDAYAIDYQCLSQNGEEDLAK